MKILFVENHALFAATVVEQLLSDHEVVVVPSVAAGVGAVGAGRFDVVLVDYDLDDGKGDELVRAVRGVLLDVPIVAVSARDEGNRAMVDAGADAVCPKRGFTRIEQVIEGARDTVRQSVCRVHLGPLEAGWVRLVVVSGADRLELDASYTPQDSLADLADALLSLLLSEGGATVELNSEPEVTILKLTPSGDQVELVLERHAGHGRRGEGRVLLHRRLSRREAVLAFYRPLQRLARGCPPEVYERAWRHAFPARTLERIGATLRS